MPTPRSAFFLLCFLTALATHAHSPPTTITFPNACIPGQTLLIAAVGDVLLHRPLQLKGERMGFESLWSPVLPYIRRANIAYANLEGPMAAGLSRNGEVYSDYPDFNYNPNLARALKSSGFQIVSTANNHALDRSAIGIDKTIAALDQAGLAYVGTRTQHSKKSWVYRSNVNGFKLAWIACTETTNDNPDRYGQVLHCYKRSHLDLIMKAIRELKHEVDAIIVTPHWGEEYHQVPNRDQKDLAHQLLNAGATIIIGSHPHVLQPMEKYITVDGRATFILYSLGNFVSYQGSPERRATIILFLGLTKNTQGTFINGVRFVPMYMQNRAGLSNIQISPGMNHDAQHIFSQILPMGNAAYSPSLLTNPQCTRADR